MRNGNMWRLHAICVACGAAAAFEPAAGAQSQSDSSIGAVEEVIVTARRREESLQEVPDAITVFTAQQIEAAGIKDIKDFAQLTPGVTVQEGFFGGDHPIVVFRGLSFTGGQAPSVAMLIDGIYLPAGEPLRNRMVDVERIEVIKGPQGALYGRDTIGGVINIITKDPSNELSGFVAVEGAEKDLWSARGAISGPIVEDELFYRFSAITLETSGFFDNALGRDHDLRDEASVRGQLLWTPGERTRVQLLGGYTDNDNGYNAAFLTHDSATHFSDIGSVLSSDSPGFNRRRNRDLAVKVDVDLGFADFNSVTQYTDASIDLLLDSDFGLLAVGALPLPFTSMTQRAFQEDDIYSQELRLVSAATQRWRWILGAYAERNDRELFLDSSFFIGDALIAGAPSTTGFSTTNGSIYGQVDYDLTPRLTFTGALRHTRDERTIDAVAPLDTPEAKDSFSITTPKASLSYDITDDIMGYLTYAEGFRSGGFDTITAVPFEPETTKNYELGLKSTWFDGRLVANLAAYYIEYQDQQVTQVVSLPGGALGSTTVNIGETELTGVELELVARPIPRLELSFGFNSGDSEIIVGSYPESAGHALPNFVDWKATLAAQYVFPLSNGWSLLTRGELYRQGPQHWGERGRLREDSYSLASARIELSSDSWAVAAAIENMLDEEYNDYLFPDIVPTWNAVYPGLPRRASVEVTFRF